MTDWIEDESLTREEILARFRALPDVALTVGPRPRVRLTERERDDLCDAEMAYRHRTDDPEAFDRYWVRTVERILGARLAART